MAHFAHLDENNNVIEVVVIPDEFGEDENGVFSEERALPFLRRAADDPLASWKQTSYNNNIRGNYAAIGGKYYPEEDVFIGPSPYDSWVVDLPNLGWQSPLGPPPTPPVTDPPSFYYWDENLYNYDNTQGWVLETPPPYDAATDPDPPGPEPTP